MRRFTWYCRHWLLWQWLQIHWWWRRFGTLTTIGAYLRCSWCGAYLCSNGETDWCDACGWWDALPTKEDGT